MIFLNIYARCLIARTALSDLWFYDRRDDWIPFKTAPRPKVINAVILSTKAVDFLVNGVAYISDAALNFTKLELQLGHMPVHLWSGAGNIYKKLISVMQQLQWLAPFKKMQSSLTNVKQNCGEILPMTTTKNQINISRHIHLTSNGAATVTKIYEFTNCMHKSYPRNVNTSESYTQCSQLHKLSTGQGKIVEIAYLITFLVLNRGSVSHILY